MSTQEFGPGVVIIGGKEYECSSFKISTKDRIQAAAQKMQVAFGLSSESFTLHLEALAHAFADTADQRRRFTVVAPPRSRKTAQWKNDKRKFR